MYKIHPSYNAKITIDLHDKDNYVKIVDNGLGIPLENFEEIFKLGGTKKSKDKLNEDISKILKGSQGVGIKASIYSSKQFKIKSTYKTKDNIFSTWEFEMDNIHDILEDSEEKLLIERPKILPEQSECTGTEILLQLEDYSVREFIKEVLHDYKADFKSKFNETDKYLCETKDEFLNLIRDYFLTNTYFGCITKLLKDDMKKINIQVNVHFGYDKSEAKNYTIKDVKVFHKSPERFLTRKRPYEIKITDSYPQYSERLNKDFIPYRDIQSTRLTKILKEEDPNKSILIQKFVGEEEIKILLGSIKKGN